MGGGYKKMNNGILYFATGEAHVKAAIKSIESVRKLNTRINIHVFTDSISDFINNSRISVREVKDTDRRARLDYFNQSPFDRTIYLDADTEVIIDKFDDMLKLMDRFDVALTHDSARYVSEKFEVYEANKKSFNDIPISFPEYNGGIIVYKKEVVDLFKKWKEKFLIMEYPESLYAPIDQPALRWALWNSHYQLTTLPIEYNVTPGIEKWAIKNYPKSWNITPIIKHSCIGYKVHIKGGIK